MILKKTRFEEGEAVNIFRQIRDGFKILHENLIMHRDLKPQNIFFDDETVVIGGFRFASMGKDEDNLKVGQILYRAPEIDTQDFYTSSCDLWSIGITFYQI